MDLRRIRIDSPISADSGDGIVPVAPDFATFVALTAASQHASATASLATRLDVAGSSSAVEDAIVTGCAGHAGRVQRRRTSRSFHLGVAKALTPRKPL